MKRKEKEKKITKTKKRTHLHALLSFIHRIIWKTKSRRTKKADPDILRSAEGNTCIIVQPKSQITLFE